MANVHVACIGCGSYIGAGDLTNFATQRCANCRGERKLAGKFGSLLVQGVLTQRELAEVKREFYSLYQIDKQLEQRKKEFMQKAQEEMQRVIEEVEAQVGRPMKELRDRKDQLQSQLQAYMTESKSAEMVIRDLLVELRDQIVNRGNMPQYKNIVEELRKLLQWSEEEMETFVKSHYSQPQWGPVMSVKPLPPGRRKRKQMGNPTASRTAEAEEKTDEHVEFKQVAPEVFHQAVSKVDKYKHVLSEISPEEYSTMRCYMNDEGTVGYALSADNDLKSVFNVSGHRGAGLAAVEDAINKGAETLDAFDGFLPKYYEQFGFKEFDRAPFDQNMKPTHWDEHKHGTPDVVYMRREREKGPVASYHAEELTLPRMAYIQDDFARVGSALCKITTPSETYILTGEKIAQFGLAHMISVQARTKETLRVADVEHRKDGVMFVLVEGPFVHDPNTLRAFLAERAEDYEITDTVPDGRNRLAVSMASVEKLAFDPIQQALSFFNQMADTVQSLMVMERRRSETAQGLMEQTTAANQMDLSDNVEDLSLKYEKNQPANGGPGSYGSGTASEGGIMSPEGDTPLISTR